MDISKDIFDDRPPQGVKFKKLLFGVCFFNAIVHERKKFGPLGWNILYDFSNSDLEVSISILKNMLMEYKAIPWDALTYLTGDITYGGRVTDDWDRRTLKSILSRFYNPQMLEDSYLLSPTGVYKVPADGDLASFKAYIESLPLNEEPSVFGMHENANVTYQLQESRRLIRTILEIQPKASSNTTGKSSEDTVILITESILHEWPAALAVGRSESNSAIFDTLFRKDENGRMINSLSTVLVQEIFRFNRLNAVVRSSLENLAKAIKGLIVMSADLELVFKSLLNNQVTNVNADSSIMGSECISFFEASRILGERLPPAYSYVQKLDRKRPAINILATRILFSSRVPNGCFAKLFTQIQHSH
jgi:dynein heavy chain